MENTWSINTGQGHRRGSVQISSLLGKRQVLNKIIIESKFKKDTLIRNNFGSPGPMIESQRVRDLPSWWEFVQYLIHTPSYRSDHALSDLIWPHHLITWLQVWWTLATIHHVLLSLFHPLQLYSAFWKHSRRRENDRNKFKCNNNFETEVHI